jgi:hypothetical protein
MTSSLEGGFGYLERWGTEVSFGPQRSTERLAYIRAIKSAVAASLHPALPRLTHGKDLFELHAADGTLIAVADSREATLAGAATFQLEPLSLH